MKDLTPDNLSLEELGIPKDEITVRFFPEAREQALIMLDRSEAFYLMPPSLQRIAIGCFIMGYISATSKNWRPW